MALEGVLSRGGRTIPLAEVEAHLSDDGIGALPDAIQITENTFQVRNVDGVPLLALNWDDELGHVTFTIGRPDGLEQFSSNVDGVATFSKAGTPYFVLDTAHYVGDPGEPAFGSPWLDDSFGYKAGFTKMGSLVFLWGVVRNGDDGSTIFTLPAGYRPGEQVELVVWNQTANVPESVRVTVDGQVVYQGAGGGNDVSISCFFVAAS